MALLMASHCVAGVAVSLPALKQNPLITLYPCCISYSAFINDFSNAFMSKITFKISAGLVQIPHKHVEENSVLL